MEPDPDFDLYEMGRLMGAECMLQNQWGGSGRDRYRPVTSTTSSVGEWYDRDRQRDYYGSNYPSMSGRYPMGGSSSSSSNWGNNRDRYYPSSSYDRDRPSDREGYYYPAQPHQHHNQGSSLLPGDRTNYFEMDSKYPSSSGSSDDKNRFPTPGGGGDKRFESDRGSGGHSADRWGANPIREKPVVGGGHSLHHYEKDPPIPMGLKEPGSQHQQASVGGGDKGWMMSWGLFSHIASAPAR